VIFKLLYIRNTNLVETLSKSCSPLVHYVCRCIYRM